MALDDISEIAVLEAADSTAPWDETSLFTYFLRDDSLLIVGTENEKIVGFAGLLMAPPESDILDITVDHNRRNLGYGTMLLRTLLQMAAEKGITTSFLEVRTGNGPARHLYEKLGFTETGIRKNYYSDPAEDAVSMRRDLAPSGDD